MDSNKISDITLRVAESDPKFVGRGIAHVDPQIIEQMNLKTGDVLQIAGNRRKTHVLLWSGQTSDTGRKVIRIDGYTRNNLGVGIDDNVSIKKVTPPKLEQIVLSPTEDLNVVGLEEYLPDLLEGRVVTKGDIIPVNMMGHKIGFVVTTIIPTNGAGIIATSTDFAIGSVPKTGNKAIPRVNYEDIGGLRHEIQKVREMIELPMRHPEIFDRIGIEAPRGVLLFGPPGTGKTLLAKAVANETNANFYSIGGPEIMSKFYGESEERLRETFKQAQENAPSIIFIDEIDSIAPKREEVSGDVEKRVVSQLLTIMDGLESRGKVVVIGATNRPDALDPALRRPGRFDREIEIGIPDQKGRQEILEIHTRGMPLTEEVKLSSIAKVTHGFVGADLEAVCREAAMKSLRNVLPEINLEESKIPVETLNKIKIKPQDFETALKEVQPSALREVYVQSPNVKWTEIGGLESIKEELREAIEWPLKHSDLFIEADIVPPKGLLLYGPPGTGKTLIAKAVATNSDANFISIKGPELLSKWVGESEKGIREVFRKARQASPCVVFFDELDSVAPRRSSSGSGDSHVGDRLVSQLLTEMDGLQDLNGVVVIGATNRPDIIDEALLRPGRFDRILEIPLPDNDSIKEILRIHMVRKPIDKSVELNKLVELCKGLSGADIAALVNAAALSAIKEYILTNRSEQNTERKELLYADESQPVSQKVPLNITMKHFEAALKKIKPNLKATTTKT
ncbi:MAG TPA: CDC48 family AAA ATPase [Nitrososphaeraceae archaeon]|nr:CDC48 family AAA ATPase [Nitrososphaeraceae archaeon]